MLKERVSAVILKNKKILLVKNNDLNFYWTPGGRVESSDQSREAAMERELREELDIILISIKSYINYKAKKDEKSELMNVYCYLVNYKGRPTPQMKLQK